MTGDTSTYPQIRWHNSLIVRVILLCAILVVCLFGSVYVIAGFYVHGMMQEMETQAQEIANLAEFRLEQNPDLDFDALEQEVMDAFEGENLFDVELSPPAEDLGQMQGVVEWSEDGQLIKVAKTAFIWYGEPVLLTARWTVSPQTEIVRAFKNRYLAALTAVFVIALGLMVYLIARTLRPLGDLSESCAQISAGNLQDVAVQKSSGEIQALEHTFNTMVSSLREKELVEANLRQAQRLTALGTLAAGIAHDIRNPLNAVKLLSSHALDNLDSVPDAAAAAKQVRTIRNEVDRLDDIVSGFLSLAKERELQLGPHQVDALLEECVRLVDKDAEARDVRIAQELRAGDTTFMLDPKQWTRAILNVLINALQACPKGGRVRLFSRLTDTTCAIEIRDDGPGMPQKVAERAFDPYFTTKKTGTGLGLSITRGIIEEHGGTIELSTSEGRGCQVLISLPLEAKVS